MRGKWILISVTAVLAGIAAGGLSLLRRNAAEKTKPWPVATRTIPRVSELSLPAVLRAGNVAPVPAPIEGTLEGVRVKVGDEVSTGMPLARINNTALEAEFATAREDLAQAESEVNNLESLLIAARLEASRTNADLGRVRSEFEKVQRAAQRQQLLYREGATPRLVYEKAQRELKAKRKQYDVAAAVARKAEDRVDTLRAQLDAARRAADNTRSDLDEISADLEAAQVLSPVDGIITGMSARQGEEVTPAMTSLFRIAVDLSQMQAIVETTPEVLRQVRPDQPVTIRVAEMPDEALPGVVREIRDGKLIVDFANPAPEIRPGLTAQVTIRVPSPPPGFSPNRQ